MLFRKLLPVLAAGAALSCTVAHAQIGVFAGYTGERIGGIACTQSASDTCSSTSTSTTYKPYGVNFGGFYDFKTIGTFRIGAVARGSVLHTNKDPASNVASPDLIREYMALGGVMASTGTPIKWLRPYGEFDAGYDKLGPVYAFNNYTRIQGLIGVDVPIASFVDIRAIELGAGVLFGPSSHGTQSISAGLVFHTPR